MGAVRAAARSVGGAWARGLAGARRSPLVQAIAVGAIALSLLLVGTVELAALNLDLVAASLRQGSQLTVYLQDGAAPSRAEQIAHALGKLPGVESARVVAPREAFARLRGSLASRAGVLDGVEESFLPLSVEASLRPGVAEVMRAHPAFSRLKRAPGVEEVELEGDWSERLRGLARLLHVAGWAVGLLVLGACLFIVGSTIRLGVFARRSEIEILKLVGATDGFVKGPFLIEGTLQGALGAAGACALLFGLYQVAAPRVTGALSGLLLGGAVRFFAPTELCAAIALGALLGLAGSALALGRYVEV